jgi:hypothetical protein
LKKALRSIVVAPFGVEGHEDVLEVGQAAREVEHRELAQLLDAASSEPVTVNRSVWRPCR